MFIIVVVLVAIAVVIFIAVHLKKRADERVVHFAMMMGAAARNSAARVREPDMRFAAEGFARIAILRKHGKGNFDLHHLERATAEDRLKKGCSLDEAFSMRWGGTMAISADPEFFDIGNAAYQEAQLAIGRAPSEIDPQLKFTASATMYLRAHLNEHPDEYERFLQHINA